MGDIKARADIRSEAKKRMRLLNFADEVTNICAGDKLSLIHI